MGHANVSNLSRFLQKRLYAKGKLSIKEMCEQAAAAGEYLQASEGDYEDPLEIAIGFAEIVHFLSRENPRSAGYTSPDGGGPWIVPALSVWIGKKRSVTHLTRMMLGEIEGGSTEVLTVNGAADRLEEEGFPEWAAFVRAVPAMRRAFTVWENDRLYDENVVMPGLTDDDDWHMAFDHIPWAFAPGWRARYMDIPLLGSISN